MKRQPHTQVAIELWDKSSISVDQEMDTVIKTFNRPNLTTYASCQDMVDRNAYIFFGGQLTNQLCRLLLEEVLNTDYSIPRSIAWEMAAANNNRIIPASILFEKTMKDNSYDPNGMIIRWPSYPYSHKLVVKMILSALDKLQA